MKKTVCAMVCTLALGLTAQSARADILLSPSVAACGSPECLAAWGLELDQPTIEGIIAGYIGTAIELYKQDHDGAETGAAAGWYTTTFFDTPEDPSGASIVWDGPGYITPPAYLLVKDGNQNPAWYLFNISNWNGQETIVLENFWPGPGAISHVSIYGGTAVPDGGMTLMLLGGVLVGLETLRRRLRR